MMPSTALNAPLTMLIAPLISFAASTSTPTATASAMTMLIINAIEVAYASDVDYIIDEETADIKLIARGALLEDDEKKRYAISGLITAYFYQLNDLVEEYYDYLEVDEREMPIESAKI